MQDLDIDDPRLGVANIKSGIIAGLVAMAAETSVPCEGWFAGLPGAATVRAAPGGAIGAGHQQGGAALGVLHRLQHAPGRVGDVGTVDRGRGGGGGCSESRGWRDLTIAASIEGPPCSAL